MRNMKWQYKTVFVILFISAVGLIFLSYFSLLGFDSQAERLIQILTGLAIAITATIALSNADRSPLQVKVNIHEPYIDTTFHRWKVCYRDNSDEEHTAKNEDEHKQHVERIKLTNEQKDFYRNCTKPIRSYVVQLRMTNKSGFCLNKPVVTFWIPVEKQTPMEKRDEQDPLFELRSNLYNSQADLRTLEMAQEVMLSNSNLPFWPNGKDMTIWIRMVLENKKSGKEPDDFDVQVSINSENALGFTQTVKLDPKELLEGKEANVPSPESGDHI